MRAALLLLALGQAMPEPPPGPPPAPPPAPDPALPAVEPAAPRRYGDRGTSEGTLILGLASSGEGLRWAAGGSYGYFVLPGVAPGAYLLGTGGGGLATTGLVLATLRLVPLRTDAVALFVMGRGGRVLLSGHHDGWGAGGGAGAILFLSRGLGLVAEYQVLQLLPASFCADLTTCRLQGLQLGLQMTF